MSALRLSGVTLSFSSFPASKAPTCSLNSTFQFWATPARRVSFRPPPGPTSFVTPWKQRSTCLIGVETLECWKTLLAFGGKVLGDVLTREVGQSKVSRLNCVLAPASGRLELCEPRTYYGDFHIRFAGSEYAEWEDNRECGVLCILLPAKDPLGWIKYFFAGDVRERIDNIMPVARNCDGFRRMVPPSSRSKCRS